MKKFNLKKFASTVLALVGAVSALACCENEVFAGKQKNHADHLIDLAEQSSPDYLQNMLIHLFNQNLQQNPQQNQQQNPQQNSQQNPQSQTQNPQPNPQQNPQQNSQQNPQSQTQNPQPNPQQNPPKAQ